ncbi:GTP cyclohydrolase II [Actinacidiphila bryophytorum]|uniref:GTP cyclohydrolase II n=1 Tax=Actinacidiphila bryophytorum TaxID=1436133 RepID=UPI003557A985
MGETSDHVPTIRGRTPIALQAGPSSVPAELISFHGLADRREHLAVRIGKPGRVPLVRLHSECLTGDVFGSLRCDCGPQLHEAIAKIDRAGGYLLYLRQEGRGIGLYNKLDAYRLQDQGLDTFAANRKLGRADDERDYTVAAQMLRSLGVDEIDLLTNNPDKVEQLRGAGIVLRSVFSTDVHSNPDNYRYLKAKVVEARHAIELERAGS